MIFYNDLLNDLVVIDNRLVQNQYESYMVNSEYQRDVYLKYYLGCGYTYIGEI